MIRYATVGTSPITESFICAAELINDEMTLSAVYSRSAEKGGTLAARHGCGRVYTDLADLAKDRSIDAVYIASPNSLHYEQSLMMLEAGKHVICEKPAAVEPQEFEKLQSIADKKGLIFTEALMGRHIDTAQSAVRDALKRLGRISHARFDFSQRSSKYDSLMSGNHENIFDPHMATGAFMDLGIYCVYPACDWFGVPKSVEAWCTKLFTGADGEGGALLRYENFNAVLTYSKTGQSRLGSEIIGDGGTLILPSISKLTDICFIDNGGKKEMLTADTDKPGLMCFEARDFCRYINGKELERYKEDSRLALQVSRVMKEIREKSGIELGCE